MARPDLPALKTIRLDEVNGNVWDLVVIGAGPAGSMAAREAALGGARVLLVDRAAFPRSKVCGCCVNGAAIGVLAAVGLGDLLSQCQARQLSVFRLATAGRAADIRLHAGMSVSRERLDSALIQAAIDAGVAFRDRTQAWIGEAHSQSRELTVRMDTTAQTAAAKAVVVAGGLGCRVFAEAAGDQRQVSESSRVGAGTVLDDAPAEFSSGTIYMACHDHGYVGLVRLEDDRLDIAAALDAGAIKKQGGIGTLVRKILASAQLPLPESLTNADWQGTGRLTQHRGRVVRERCFFIGDAAGYVEPFTGEGIAWALASGRAVAPIVLELVRNGGVTDAMQSWTDTHRHCIARRARLCRWVSRLLRYPRIVRIAVRLLAWAPGLAQPLATSLNASFEVQPPSHDPAQQR